MLHAISPACCSKSGGTELRIEGDGLFETNTISVRFKEKGGEGRETTMNAVCRTDVYEAVLNPETEEEEDVEHSYILCPSPQFDGELPIETRVAVAINGQDFVTLSMGSLIVHDARVGEISPAAVPLLGPKEERRSVELLGSSFFDSGTLRVRLTFEHEGEDAECVIPAEYVSREVITFFAPTLRQLLGLPERMEATEEGEEEVEGAANAAPAPSEPKPAASSDVVAAEGEDEPVADVEGEGEVEAEEKLPQRNVFLCQLELSVDGETYVEGKVPFTCYVETGFSVDPGCGPASGGTEVALWCDANFADAQAQVQLSSEDGYYAVVPGVTQMRTRINAETGEEEDALAVLFTTPEPHFRPVANTAVEAAADSGEAAAATADETEVDADAEAAAADAEPAADPEPEPDDEAAPDGEAEGEAVEPAEEGMTDADAMSHRTKDGAYSVSVSIAMNGQDFSPFTTEFAFYQDPTLEERNPQEVVAGSSVELKGKGLFDSGLIVVRLTYPSESAPSGEESQTVQGEYDSLIEGIKFELPEMAVTPAPVEEPDVGDEDAEEDEPAEPAEDVEVVPDGMVPIGVEVSLNGGANFTTSGLRIFYTPSSASDEPPPEEEG